MVKAGEKLLIMSKDLGEWVRRVLFPFYKHVYGIIVDCPPPKGMKTNVEWVIFYHTWILKEMCLKGYC